MLQYIKTSGSVRINGSLVLREREFAQRDDGKWFARVKDVSTKGWYECDIAFCAEVQPHFWIIKVDGKQLDGAVRLLPKAVHPKLRLPK